MERKAYTQKTNKSSQDNNKYALSSITSNIMWPEKKEEYIYILEFRRTNILILINNNTDKYLILLNTYKPRSSETN